MAILIKQALSIGNDAYPEGGRLKSCVSDATDMSLRLHTIGFQVQKETNLDYASMEVATQRFIQSIQPGAIVLLYYSGHGVQYDGYNFLMPTGNDAFSEENIKFSAFSAERLIADMHRRRPRVVIVILDSCRSYWGPQSLLRPKSNQAQSRIRPGLAPMQVPPATIVAYACASEEVSSPNSANGRNSMYTFHLLRHITTPNMDIEQVLRNVAVDVARDPLNGLRQIPYRYSSCNEHICLASNIGMNVTGWPGINQPIAFFAPFKNSFAKVYSNRHSWPPINYKRYHVLRHHYPTYIHALTKVMRYPTGLGYPFDKSLYNRRY